MNVHKCKEYIGESIVKKILYINSESLKLDFAKFWHPLRERGKLQRNEFSRKRVFTPS